MSVRLGYVRVARGNMLYEFPYKTAIPVRCFTADSC